MIEFEYTENNITYLIKIITEYPDGTYNEPI